MPGTNRDITYIIMKNKESKQGEQALTPQAESKTEQQESTHGEPERPLTPLERVRAGQAKMRGNKTGGVRGAQSGGAASSGGAHQRTQYPRKSG